MSARANLEAAADLALIPLAGVLAGLSAVAVAPLLLFGAFLSVWGTGGWYAPLWCFAAGCLAVRNAVAGVEVMGDPAPAPLLGILAWSGVAAAACPLWWVSA
jgi:hypothetical protein